MRYWKSRKFEKTPTVGVGVACHIENNTETTFRRVWALKALVASFGAQTYHHWKMRIAHDGPSPAWFTRVVDELTVDPRVEFVQTTKRENQFGHPHRQATLDHLAKTCEWLMLTNDDNYYMPVFLEWLLHTGVNLGHPMVYCDMVHSHKSWKHFPTAPVRGKLDLGGLIVHRDLAAKVKFNKTDFAADGDWINRLTAASGNRAGKVNATLFVHN